MVTAMSPTNDVNTVLSVSPVLTLNLIAAGFKMEKIFWLVD